MDNAENVNGVFVVDLVDAEAADADMPALDDDMPALEEVSPACKGLARVLAALSQTYSALRRARAETPIEQVCRGSDAYGALSRGKQMLENLGQDVYRGAPACEPNRELWNQRAARVRRRLAELHTLSLPYSERFLL